LKTKGKQQLSPCKNEVVGKTKPLFGLAKRRKLPERYAENEIILTKKIMYKK
jgi:hypothetical protein